MDFNCNHEICDHLWEFRFIFSYYSRMIFFGQFSFATPIKSAKWIFQRLNGIAWKRMTHLLWKVSYFCVYVIDSANSNTSNIFLCVKYKEKKKCRLVSFENDRRNMNRTWKICHSSISKSFRFPFSSVGVINACWFAYFIFKHIFTRRISALIGQ